MNKEPNTKPETLAIQPKGEWTIAEALQFANTLSNHGWTREANADAASSCIYALCRKLRERGNSAAMREACANIVEYTKTAACHTEDAHLLCYLDQIERWAEAALAALSAPPRNCDVQTAEESEAAND